MPTLLSLGEPATFFQFTYMVYLYGLPLLLWAAFAWLVIEEQERRAVAAEKVQPLQLLVALLLPLVGAVCVLLAIPRTRRAHGLVILIGLLAFLLPLAAGVWLAGGPLGPKALG
ncbi:MAG: hypothetical protein WCP04_09525 [Pseudomonadota bacterium]|jgi:hypothetical protein